MPERAQQKMKDNSTLKKFETLSGLLAANKIFKKNTAIPKPYFA